MEVTKDVPTGLVGDAKRVPVSKLSPAQRAELVAAREAELDMMCKYGVFQSVDPSKYDLRRLRPLRLKFIYE